MAFLILVTSENWRLAGRRRTDPRNRGVARETASKSGKSDAKRWNKPRRGRSKRDKVPPRDRGRVLDAAPPVSDKRGCPAERHFWGGSRTDGVAARGHLTIGREKTPTAARHPPREGIGGAASAVRWHPPNEPASTGRIDTRPREAPTRPVDREVDRSLRWCSPDSTSGGTGGRSTPRRLGSLA